MTPTLVLCCLSSDSTQRWTSHTKYRSAGTKSRKEVDMCSLDICYLAHLGNHTVYPVSCSWARLHIRQIVSLFTGQYVHILFLLCYSTCVCQKVHFLIVCLFICSGRLLETMRQGLPTFCFSVFSLRNVLDNFIGILRVVETV